ncbi:hypothetical protein BDM02DRAFT_3152797 [Thelephora ganbajun]|uniref:Uncharacterized protein n=1 Tax=Thelephora ganbajun TaxID=370292 RepID=A0ACB6ZVY4_THEGA|nr:hypothetical protein BDM02DRAFT_3152797 [Thelephora ganbajun]
MDKTKSRLAAFFDEDDEDDGAALPQKNVDEHKLNQYTQGTQRKSKREKEKEEAERKRKEEEEHAKKAYAEFLETFEGTRDDGRKKGFVRSTQDSGGAEYAHNRSEASSRPAPRVPSPSPALPKGKRAMDSFLEEIKRDQAEREAKYSRHVHGGRSVTAMAAYEGQSGSKDRGDPETTNVFVANLPPHVTEQSLGNFFARIGPVASVKIMWPRSDSSKGPGNDMSSRRNKTSGLSGFVSFMKRRDAEEALRELDGFDWGGSILRVGWSKAVPVGTRAMYKSRRSRSRSYSSSRSRSPRRRDHRGRDRGGGHYRRRSRSYSRSRSPRRNKDRGYPRDTDEKKLLGDDDVTEEFIRIVIVEVKGRGEEYEAALKEREKGNSKYSFLTDHKHRKHGYYRSFMRSSKEMNTEFDDGGYNSIYSTDSAEESEQERTRKHHLGKLARKRFEAMLRALSGRRGELARCMAFSLEHAEAASEIVDIIISSLLVPETAVPRKVARLHLICDILHNSAAPLPMAWKFRQEFQARLGIVFDHMSTIYHSFPGRITAETFKKQIMNIVEIWEDWIVFAPEFTKELRDRLDGKEEAGKKGTEEIEGSDKDAGGQTERRVYESKFKASSFKPATEEAQVEAPEEKDGEDIDGEPVMDDLDGEPLGGGGVDGIPMDDVDGEPLDCELLDGEPLDGEPLRDEDLDGEPMRDEDLDGEPMDEDVDGVQMHSD